MSLLSRRVHSVPLLKVIRRLSKGVEIALRSDLQTSRCMAEVSKLRHMCLVDKEPGCHTLNSQAQLQYTTMQGYPPPSCKLLLNGVVIAYCRHQPSLWSTTLIGMYIILNHKTPGLHQSLTVYAEAKCYYSSRDGRLKLLLPGAPAING